MRRLYFPILIMIGWLVSLAGCASSPGPQPSIASSGPSAPATVSRYPYAVDSFYTFNGDLVHMWQDWNSNEQTREIWPLSAIGKPAVVVRNSSQVVTVLFRTSNGGLQEMSFVQDQGWSQPTELVTSNVSSDPAAAVTPDNNHQAVVWVDTTGTLYQRLWDEATGGWQPSSSIMANITSHPTLSSRRSDAIDGFVITSGQKLTHFAWGKWGDSWKWEVQEFKSADCPSGAISSPSTFNLSDGAMDTVHRIKGSLRDCYWGPDNWQHYEWPAQMATDPAVTVLDGIGYAAYVEVGGNLVIRAIRRQDQAPIPDVSNVVFRDASESYPPSITTRNGALELVFWAGDGSLKRVRVEAGSLTAGAPKTVTPQP